MIDGWNILWNYMEKESPSYSLTLPSCDCYSLNPVLLFKVQWLEHATFICRNHIFDVNVCIFPTMFFKYFQCFLDQITKLFVFPL